MDVNEDIDLYDEHYKDRPLHPLALLLGKNPTNAMCDAGRAAVMARDCSGPKWTPRQHYEASGNSTRGIPDDLLDIPSVPKEAGALTVWYAMLAHLPETFGPKPDVELSQIQYVHDPLMRADFFIQWIKHDPRIVFDREVMAQVFMWVREYELEYYPNTDLDANIVITRPLELEALQETLDAPPGSRICDPEFGVPISELLEQETPSTGSFAKALAQFRTLHAN